MIAASTAVSLNNHGTHEAWCVHSHQHTPAHGATYTDSQSTPMTVPQRSTCAADGTATRNENQSTTLGTEALAVALLTPSGSQTRVSNGQHAATSATQLRTQRRFPVPRASLRAHGCCVLRSQLRRLDGMQPPSHSGTARASGVTSSLRRRILEALATGHGHLTRLSLAEGIGVAAQRWKVQTLTTQNHLMQAHSWTCGMEGRAHGTIVSDQGEHSLARSQLTQVQRQGSE